MNTAALNWRNIAITLIIPLRRVPLVGFDYPVLWRKGYDVVTRNERRERMGIHLFHRTILIREMDHATFPLVIVWLSILPRRDARESPICTDANDFSAFV